MNSRHKPRTNTHVAYGYNHARMNTLPSYPLSCISFRGRVGLRRWIKAPISQGAWVRIPPGTCSFVFFNGGFIGSTCVAIALSGVLSRFCTPHRPALHKPGTEEENGALCVWGGFPLSQLSSSFHHPPHHIPQPFRDSSSRIVVARCGSSCSFLSSCVSHSLICMRVQTLRDS